MEIYVVRNFSAYPAEVLPDDCRSKHIYSIDSNFNFSDVIDRVSHIGQYPEYFYTDYDNAVSGLMDCLYSMYYERCCDIQSDYDMSDSDMEVINSVAEANREIIERDVRKYSGAAWTAYQLIYDINQRMPPRDMCGKKMKWSTGSGLWEFVCDDLPHTYYYIETVDIAAPCNAEHKRVSIRKTAGVAADIPDL